MRWRDGAAQLPESSKGALPGLASASRCYVSFCQLRDITPLPPTEDKVVQRICVFDNNATFGNYVSYLEK